MKIMINGRPLQQRVEELTTKEAQHMEQVKLMSYAAILTVLAYMLQLVHKVIEHHYDFVQVAYKALEAFSL